MTFLLLFPADAATNLPETALIPPWIFAGYDSGRTFKHYASLAGRLGCSRLHVR